MRDKHHVLVISVTSRSTLEHTLERAGYHVSWAAHAPTVLQQLANERIDAVVLDGQSCKLSAAMMEALRELWPHAAMLLLSETVTTAEAQRMAENGWRLLRKPVTAYRLKQCLKGMLPLPTVTVPVHSLRISAPSVLRHPLNAVPFGHEHVGLTNQLSHPHRMV